MTASGAWPRRAAIIASNQHDDHHNKNQNKNYNNSYNNGYNNNYDNRYDGRYDSRYNDNYRNYDNSRYGYNGYGGDPRRTFTCESRNDRRNYCSIPGRGHVEIYKQRSSNPCRHLLVGLGRQQRVGRRRLQGRVRGLLTPFRQLGDGALTIHPDYVQVYFGAGANLRY